ncbi:hypothetical protein AYI70_g8489 [Smittium culicis]|uniref:Uncharacterized protein n=1 Tax=Smittium culicis TaxID=133412 RepID=A0A1R1XFP1_9FUNG|nr:hypothetical protein AYI70_g8489 [Smittium culicis]
MDNDKKIFGFEQKEKARNSSIFLPFTQNDTKSNLLSEPVSAAVSSTVPTEVPTAVAATEIPTAVAATEFYALHVAVTLDASAADSDSILTAFLAPIPTALNFNASANSPAPVTSAEPITVATVESESLPSADCNTVANTILEEFPSGCSKNVSVLDCAGDSDSRVPVVYIELVDYYISTNSRGSSETQKSGSISVAPSESNIDHNSQESATSLGTVKKKAEICST